MLCPVCLTEHEEKDMREIANGYKICKECYEFAQHIEPEFLTANIKEFLYMLDVVDESDENSSCIVPVFAVLDTYVDDNGEEHVDTWAINTIYLKRQDPILEHIKDKMLY